MAELPERRRKSPPDYGAWTARAVLMVLLGIATLFLGDARSDLKDLVKFSHATDRRLDKHEFRLDVHDAKLFEQAEALKRMEFLRKTEAEKVVPMPFPVRVPQ